jgi:hypothetical protein
MGFNEASGYLAVALTALTTGFIASTYGLRPEPFYLGIAFAALSLGMSTLLVRETLGHTVLEAATHSTGAGHSEGDLTTGEIFRLTSFNERHCRRCRRPDW